MDKDISLDLYTPLEKAKLALSNYKDINLDLYTPKFIKCFCFINNITLKEFYNSYNFSFGYVFFIKVLNGTKLINYNFKREIALCFNEVYKPSTRDIIDVLKVVEIIKN